jgi:hypothetical protein
MIFGLAAAIVRFEYAAEGGAGRLKKKRSYPLGWRIQRPARGMAASAFAD